MDFLDSLPLPPVPPASGILLVDKPSGPTSHDIVYAVQRFYDFKRKGEGKVKVGHAGTLDPLASGLLIVLIGSATKRTKDFEGLDKTYEVTARLGQVRDSYDIEGEIILDARVREKRGDDERCRDENSQDEKAGMRKLFGVEGLNPSVQDLEELDAETVKKALRTFVGAQDQRVPAYAAVKVGGRKLYEMARSGNPMPYVELPVKRITIFEIKDVVFTPCAPMSHEQSAMNNPTYPSVSFTVHVSKGTYIRSLVHELGILLGVGACVEVLRRVRVGDLRMLDTDDRD